MDALGKVVMELYKQWEIECKLRDFECAIMRLLKLKAIDRPVDILHSGCWERCTNALANDVIVSGTSKCLKSWGRVAQALEKALLEQETWKAAQSSLKITPKVGVGATTQTAFGDCAADPSPPPKTNGCSWSQSPNSTPDLTTKPKQPLNSDGVCEPRSDFDRAGPEEVWGGPPPYVPQHGAGREEEGRGEELLPATRVRRRDPEDKGEESAGTRGEESPRLDRGRVLKHSPIGKDTPQKGGGGLSLHLKAYGPVTHQVSLPVFPLSTLMNLTIFAFKLLSFPEFCTTPMTMCSFAFKKYPIGKSEN
ncbi:PREDICTED: uncharacterized protein LOC101822246 [Ficedula albicollis]|uniref:uncharacterized protein LOC101822246 n=1 Tax=Ficedula albicollis TaxID=59894 RepID=UPI000359ADE0|nr:PREDICTED: uncharacterized protein LOC101822246 [Ficedula albicollis]